MRIARRPVLIIESLRLRRRADWTAAFGAGLAAGAAMALAPVLALDSLALSALERRVGALILGPGVLPPPATSDLAITVAAVVVHGFLSAAFALPLADAVFRLEPRAAVPLGGLYGVFLYILNLHVFTRVFPWFAFLRGPKVFALHVLYGLVAAYVYGRFERERLRG